MAQRPSPSMMARRVHEYGPPEVMRFERIPRPDPGPGVVLVKVEAVGVGPWDGWIRTGKSALPQPLPLTLGSDLAGKVIAAGPVVSRLRVGDNIYGVTNHQFVGAYAEHALASAAMVASKPTTLSYTEAASVPVVAVTAQQALFDHAQLKAGRTVLIHGAAGSVGAFAIQLARRAGLPTIATAARDDSPPTRRCARGSLHAGRRAPSSERKDRARRRSQLSRLCEPSTRQRRLSEHDMQGKRGKPGY